MLEGRMMQCNERGTMSENKFILFDCMETLVDMVELPGEKEYALWALEGSGVETYWKDPEEFVRDFIVMRKGLKERQPYYQEFDIYERFQLVVEKKIGKSEDMTKIVQQLVTNYWQKYLKMCYVSEDVRVSLGILAERYKMGIVSNFIILGGVEQLLELQGIAHFFQFIVTSVKEGWRKPHPLIYATALKQLGAGNKKEVLFIGDDLENDYLTPHKLGIKAILYDRNDKYPMIKERFNSFMNLVDLVDSHFS